jgi:hypothetical protein
MTSPGKQSMAVTLPLALLALALAGTPVCGGESAGTCERRRELPHREFLEDPVQRGTSGWQRRHCRQLH